MKLFVADYLIVGMCAWVMTKSVLSLDFFFFGLAYLLFNSYAKMRAETDG